MYIVLLNNGILDNFGCFYDYYTALKIADKYNGIVAPAF